METDPARALARFIADLDSPELFDDDFVSGLLTRFSPDQILVSFCRALGDLLEREPFNAEIVLETFSTRDLIDHRAAAVRWKQYLAASLATASDRDRGEQLSMKSSDLMTEVVGPVVADGISGGRGIVGPALTELMALGYTCRALSKIIRDQLDEEHFAKVLDAARQMAAESQAD